MFTVALTGGIGSGKSTVADWLAELGAGVVDTDAIARDLTAPGQPLLRAIAAAFGADLIDAAGVLDRAALRARVFGEPAERLRLEAILHPPIRDAMWERLAQLDTPYAVVVIPLLFETAQAEAADRVLVVDAPEACQIARVQARSGLAGDEIRRIMASQWPRAARLAKADDVLDNAGDLAALRVRVERLHERYLDLARAAAMHRPQ